MKRNFTTERLLLRQWKEEDRTLFSAMNRDPEVMRYFPRHFTSDESAVMKRIGMLADPFGFEHPRIDAGSHLRKHVVYRLGKEHWLSQQAEPA